MIVAGTVVLSTGTHAVGALVSGSPVSINKTFRKSAEILLVS